MKDSTFLEGFDLPWRIHPSLEDSSFLGGFILPWRIQPSLKDSTLNSESDWVATHPLDDRSRIRRRINGFLSLLI